MQGAAKFIVQFTWWAVHAAFSVYCAAFSVWHQRVCRLAGWCSQVQCAVYIVHCAAFDTWLWVCRLAGWVQPSAARRAELEGRLLLARTDMTNGLRTSRRPIIPSATLCCTLLQPGATCTTAPPGLQITSTITICCHPLLHTVVTCTMASAPPGAPPDLHIAPAARISSVRTCAYWHKCSTIVKV